MLNKLSNAPASLTAAGDSTADRSQNAIKSSIGKSARKRMRRDLEAEGFRLPDALPIAALRDCFMAKFCPTAAELCRGCPDLQPHTGKLTIVIEGHGEYRRGPLESVPQESGDYDPDLSDYALLDGMEAVAEYERQMDLKRDEAFGQRLADVPNPGAQRILDAAQLREDVGDCVGTNDGRHVVSAGQCQKCGASAAPIPLTRAELEAAAPVLVHGNQKPRAPTPAMHLAKSRTALDRLLSLSLSRR